MPDIQTVVQYGALGLCVFVLTQTFVLTRWIMAEYAKRIEELTKAISGLNLSINEGLKRQRDEHERFDDRLENALRNAR